MSKRPARVSRAFKLELCKRIAAKEFSINQASKRYGLEQSTVSRWFGDYESRGEMAFTINGAPVPGDHIPAIRPEETDSNKKTASRTLALESALGRAYLKIEKLKAEIKQLKQ